jgi:tetratricopeptide (TPR) repeat protein
MKKTKTESEKIHRSIIGTSIDLASIKFQQEKVEKYSFTMLNIYLKLAFSNFLKYEEAIELYQSFLDSEKDLAVHDIKLNTLQSIHAYHNYIEAIEKINQKTSVDLNNNIPSDSKQKSSKINSLKKKLQECEHSYVLSFDEEKLSNEQRLKEKLEFNKFFSQSKFSLEKNVSDLGDLLDDIKLGEKSQDFWKKITSRFGTHKADENLNEYVVENVVYGKVVMNIDQIKLILLNEFGKLLGKRENTIDLMLTFFDKKTSIHMKCKLFLY